MNLARHTFYSHVSHTKKKKKKKKEEEVHWTTISPFPLSSKRLEACSLHHGTVSTNVQLGIEYRLSQSIYPLLPQESLEMALRMAFSIPRYLSRYLRSFFVIISFVRNILLEEESTRATTMNLCQTRLPMKYLFVNGHHGGIGNPVSVVIIVVCPLQWSNRSF